MNTVNLLMDSLMDDSARKEMYEYCFTVLTSEEIDFIIFCPIAFHTLVKHVSELYDDDQKNDYMMEIINYYTHSDADGMIGIIQKMFQAFQVDPVLHKVTEYRMIHDFVSSDMQDAIVVHYTQKVVDLFGIDIPGHFKIFGFEFDDGYETIFFNIDELLGMACDFNQNRSRVETIRYLLSKGTFIF